jgi:hypothetical protein
MKNKTLKYGLAGVLTALLIAGIVQFLVSERLETFEQVIAVQHEKQRALLGVLAETTARNGADSITETIVRDCELDQRDRFDTLLGSLDAGLSQSELVELERLFASCGSFFAERKSIMVSRLERELDLYISYTEQLETLTDESYQESAQIQAWTNLVDFEKQQDAHFSTLVRLQENIINALLAGNITDSEEIQTILAEVREARENLAFANTRAAELRQEVLTL